MPEVWPFPPLTPMVETFSGLTESIRSFSAEQRIKLREARQTLTFAHLFTPEQEARAQALMRSNAGGEWYVPLWHQGRAVFGLTAADTTIAVDTTTGDWRVGGRALVWGSDQNNTLVELSAVSSGSITLTVALGEDYAEAFVAPVLRCLTRSLMAEVAEDRSHGRGQSVFEVAESPVDLAENGYDTYESASVLTTPPLTPSAVSTSVGTVSDYVDSGLGLVVREDLYNYTEATTRIEILDTTRTDGWRRRKWLEFVAFSQKAFWLPSYRADLSLAAAIDASDVEITVTGIGAASAYGGRHIMILLKDGTRFYREIVSVAVGATTVALGISASLGVGVVDADVDLISFMASVRLLSDDVSRAHHLTGYSNTTFAVVEVPA